MEGIAGYNLYIQPTYIVQIPEYNLPPWAGKRVPDQLYQCPLCTVWVNKIFPIKPKNSQVEVYGCIKCQQKANLSENSTEGSLSKKADQRLKNAINWLVSSAKYKRIYCKIEKKHFSFKLNFITLTLPTTEHNISDKHFTGVMLRKFINSLYYRVNLKNYIWRVEPQKNGNIHCHFITDTFIHHRVLRNIWNKILMSEGLIQTYANKFSSLSENQYLQLYNGSDNTNITLLRKRYQHGVSTNWKEPNTTDVHAIKNLKNLAAYLTKYMAKEQKDRRKLKCRLWGASQSLSANNKLTYFCGNYDSDEVLQSLKDKDIEFKIIEANSEGTGPKREIGTIYFIKPSFWENKIKGKLKQLYDDHRFYIRCALPKPPEYEIDLQSNVSSPTHTKEIEKLKRYQSKQNKRICKYNQRAKISFAHRQSLQLCLDLRKNSSKKSKSGYEFTTMKNLTRSRVR